MNLFTKSPTPPLLDRLYKYVILIRLINLIISDKKNIDRFTIVHLGHNGVVSHIGMLQEFIAFAALTLI